MKLKLFFVALLSVGFFSFANAQYVNETPISEIDADYIRIWSDSGPLLSSKITVRIDWGQGGRTPQITDNNATKKSFSFIISVFNKNIVQEISRV